MVIAMSRSRWYSRSVKRLGRRDRDRIAGVHAHRIKVFNRADDDDVISEVAHHFQLEFFPPQDRFFDQNLMNGRSSQTVAHDLSNSSGLNAVPAPVPPRVKEGRMIAG